VLALGDVIDLKTLDFYLNALDPVVNTLTFPELFTLSLFLGLKVAAKLDL